MCGFSWKECCALFSGFLWGFPGGSDVKEPAFNMGNLGLIPGLGRSPGGGKGYLLQYSGLGNPMGWQRVGHD